MQYGFITRFKNEILANYFTNNDDFASKPLYVGLLISEGQPDEVPVELPISVTTGYARAAITFGPAHDGIVENSNQVLFPQAITNWTTGTEKIFAIGIFNSENEDFADSCLVYLPLSESEEVLAGETFSLNPNSIRLQLA